MKIDEAKVEAIRNMPAPTDVTGVKRLRGMVQYMSRFMPDLARTLEQIRALNRKDTSFVWSTECENTFDMLKINLSKSLCLAYFDVSKEVVIQVDSSKHGIGAVPLQGGRPVEYGHKLLAAILQKPLSQAPKRLQRANGKAESAVKIMKSLLMKTHKERGDPYEPMLEQRNTPRQDTGLSLAEMMFSRRTRSFLPSMSSSPKDPLVKKKREARNRSVKKAHERKSRRLSEIDVGQSVFFQYPEGQNWKLGRVTDILGPNTYQVIGPKGGT